MEYLVTWKIDIDADNPDEAATKALLYQRDPESTAVVFDVTDANGTTSRVDLAREDLPSGDAEQDDGNERPRTTCGCGFEIVYTEEGWQHDAAPYFWGNDHDADPDPDAQARAEAWDAEHEED